MNANILFTLLGGTVGGLVGSLFSVYVPRLLFAPKLRITAIQFHESHHSYNFVVINKGKAAALNAAGRLTIRLLDCDSVIGTRPQSAESTHEVAIKPGDWRRNDHVLLYKEDWEIGIEAEHVYWATLPNLTNIDINRGVSERIAIAHSEGPWVNIASESFSIKRARLTLEKGTIYYGELKVFADNCSPSPPFRFKIYLGSKGYAKLESYKGKLPKRPHR